VYDLFVTEDFSFKGEVDEHKQLLLHMEIRRWSPSVCRRMQLIASEGLEGLKNQGFRCMYCVTDSPKLVQLVCPGRVFNTVTYLDKEYEVILWDFH
jgi:hypothetical protein